MQRQFLFMYMNFTYDWSRDPAASDRERFGGSLIYCSSGMAKVQVTDVTVLDNPSPFANPFQFEITFDCSEDLPEG